MPCTSLEIDSANACYRESNVKALFQPSGIRRFECRVEEMEIRNMLDFEVLSCLGKSEGVAYSRIDPDNISEHVDDIEPFRSFKNDLESRS